LEKRQQEGNAGGLGSGNPVFQEGGAASPSNDLLPGAITFVGHFIFWLASDDVLGLIFHFHQRTSYVPYLREKD